MKKIFTFIFLAVLVLAAVPQGLADESIVPYMGGPVVGASGVKRVIWGVGSVSGGGSEGYISLYQGGGGVPAPQLGYAVVGLSAGEDLDTSKCFIYVDESGIGTSSRGLSVLEISEHYLRVKYDGQAGSNTNFSFQIVEFE